MDKGPGLPVGPIREPAEVSALRIAEGPLGLQRAAFEQSNAGIIMTQPFYVAVPYTMAELSEAEEQHEIGEYIDYVGYDVRGFHGEVRLDDRWHTLWSFSEADAARFIAEWGGILLDEAAQKRVTGQRSREAEMLKDLEEHLARNA